MRDWNWGTLLRSPPAAKWDWEACANRHLLAHILRRAHRRVYYCAPIDTLRGASPFPAPLSLELAGILKAHAHCWALDMAEWPHYPPTAAEQRVAWEKAMEDADRECRKVREESAIDALPK